MVTTFWLLIALAGAWSASSIDQHLSRSFDAPGQPAYEANEKIVARYGNGGVIPPIVLVATPRAGSFASDAVRREMGAATRRVAAAVPGSRTLAAGEGAPQEEFRSADGRIGWALIFPPIGRPAPDENEAALAAARSAAGRESVGGAPLRVTGIEALSEDSGGGGGLGLLAETLFGAFGALLVLALVFGSWLALVPLLIAAVSILTTFALLRVLAELTQVSFVVQFLVGLIGLGVAIDYSLLVVFRWREARARGVSGQASVAAAMRTAGRAVAVSGFTVGIGLLAMVVVPIPFIRSIGFGGLLIPIVSVLTALTLLPIMLAALGERLDRRHRVSRDASAGEGWTRWSRFVVRRRWPAALVGLLVLLALSALALRLNPGEPAADSISSGGEAEVALETLERSGIGSGVLTPVEVIARPATATAISDRVGAVEGIAASFDPSGGAWRRDGSALVVAVPRADAGSEEGRASVDRVRALEPAELGEATVGGPAAQDRDLTEAIYASFPLMVGVIALITFALLGLSLRSLVLPLKAIALNVLSIGASFGIVVLVWQEGWGSELIGGVPATGAIVNWVPLAIFAFLYGLSMDYEVFILSRVREEYDETGSTEEAVVRGLGRTGRLVTSAALVLFLAFVALAAGPSVEIKVLATGLAAGIALDATVVRAFVVPALVVLLGKANWWWPRRRARSLRPR